MNRRFVLMFLSLFFIFSCKEPDSKPESNNEDVKANYSVEFRNSSIFSVVVYSDPQRAISVCELAPSEKKSADVELNSIGTSFYLTYIVDVGVKIPWNDNNSYVIVVPDEEKTAQSVINDPNSMRTSTCFVVIENESSSQVVLKRGASELHPENESDANKTILLPSESGVYSVTLNSFGNFSSYKLQTSNNVQIGFPENFTKFESGKIFTIVVSEKDGNLSSAIKSISPFDIDTRRQIWSSEPIAAQYSVDCVRPAYDVKNGSFYAGSVVNKANTVFIEVFDVYGKVKVSGDDKLHKEFVIAPGGNYTGYGCEVLDAAQTSDGKYLLLIRQYLSSEPSDINAFYYVYYVDESGNNKKLLDLTDFAQHTLSFDRGNVWFYGNLCKGALCPIGDDKCGIFGSVWDEDNKIYYLAALADFSSETPSVVKHWTSPESCNLSGGVYKSFTSGWYDDTTSSFYVAGYDNFSSDYDNPQHKGVIYKISSDLSSASEEKSFEKTLFFGITGKNGQYYACGETMGNSADRNLYGGFISRTMVDSEQEIIRHRSTKQNTYFTQISFTNNGLAICGSNSSSNTFDSDDTEGVLTCFSTSGVKLWENNYSDYKTIKSMSENNIGTQILHVVKSDGKSKILSTDLLGREYKR